MAEDGAMPQADGHTDEPDSDDAHKTRNFWRDGYTGMHGGPHGEYLLSLSQQAFDEQPRAIAEAKLVKDLAEEMYQWAMVDGIRMMAIKPSFTIGQVHRAVRLFHGRQQRFWAEFHLLPGEPAVRFTPR